MTSSNDWPQYGHWMVSLTSTGEFNAEIFLPQRCKQPQGVTGSGGQERGQHCPRAAGVWVETRGHGCPRSDSSQVDRHFQSRPQPEGSRKKTQAGAKAGLRSVQGWVLV
jgi:hypothetical protein